MLDAASANASVHDIHLHTDSTPDYVSIEDFVATATSVWDDPEDEAIALWRWMVRSHLQTSTTREDGAPIWDPIRFYGSYANTNCGYKAAFLTAFVETKGGNWRHRYVELSDHTVAEVSWDAGATWHMFDASMVVYARRHDGAIASCADIATATSCDLSDFWGDPAAEPGHLYLYHAAAECMTNPPDPDHPFDLGYPSGYRKGADNPVPFSRTLRNGADSYLSGFDVQEAFTHIRRGWRNRLHLHPGHSYTRYWLPLGAGPEYARLTTKGNDPNDSYYPANIRSNGRWEIAPDFTAADVRGGWHQLTGLVHRDQDGGAGPILRPGPDVNQADAVVKIDAANVITSAGVYLAGQRGSGDQVTLEFSRDAGCTWTQVAAPAAGSFATWYNLPANLVGGAFEVLLRVRLVPDATRQDCGLNDLRVEATTQLNRMTLPRLQRGANRVRFAAGPPRETLTLRPTLHAGSQYHWTVSAADFTGLTSQIEPGGYSSAIVVPTLANAPGSVTWRVDTPSDLLSATFGGSFLTRYGGSGDQVRLRYSWDGQNFTTAAVFDAGTAPTWNAILYATPDLVPPDARAIWLQYDVHSSVSASSQSTGIQDALLQVHHAAHDPTFVPVEVTWCWIEHRTEGGLMRRHTRVVTTADEVWDLNVSGYRDPTMQWVRVQLADPGASEGYDDGIDVGPGAGFDLVKISADWIDDLAFGRSYTVSRPASSVNPDTDGLELTDGVIIPPTTYQTSTYVQGQVAYWEGDDPLTVTVDLGSEQPVHALRVTSHQPSAQFGHAGTIAAFGLDDDGAATSLGVIQHDDIWSPSGDHLDWGYWRSGDFADLPAGGRLAHGYWLVLETPTTARQVRLEILPLAGHGVGISEVQVFSAVSVSDWPDREVDLGAVSAVVFDDAPASRQRQHLSVTPNPANPGTFIGYELPRASRVVMRMIDVRGRLVRNLVDGWRPAGAHRAFWDGRDNAGRAVASGVYLAVGEWTGGRTIGRVTLVR
ncbi:MAG: hypothetical protein KAH56_01625 [Candidatus Krumholzibacteria bacterium]|nr:hypothetical protein [Candidatus Krumholzibacteria bacterium]